MTNVFSNEIESLIRKAPIEWIASVCEILRASPASATEDNILTLMPPTNNADLSFQMNKVIRLASSKMTWEALSWALDTTYKMYYRWLADTLSNYFGLGHRQPCRYLLAVLIRRFMI